MQNHKIKNFLAVSILCLLFATSVSITFFKVPSALTLISSTFDLEKAQTSQLMSAYTLGGIISVVLAGILVNKFGARNSLMACVIFSAIGSVIGSFAGVFGQNAFGVLLACRTLEGFLNTFTSVCMPIIIVDVVDPRRVGISITIYACWMSLGTVLSQTFTPVIMSAFGFTLTWLLFALLTVVSGGIIWLFVAPAPDAPKTTYYEKKAKKTAIKEFSANNTEEGRAKFKKHKKNLEPLMTRPIVGSCVVFLLMYGILCFVQISITNYIPYGLQINGGYDESTSGLYASIPSIIQIFVSVIFGIIYDRTGRYKTIFIACCFMGALGTFLMFEADSMKIFFCGCGVSGFAFSIFSLGAIATNDLFGRKRMESGMTLLIMMGVVGQFAGSSVTALLMGEELTNFEFTGIVLTIFSVIASFFALLIVPRKRAIKRAIYKFVNPPLKKIKK